MPNTTARRDLGSHRNDLKQQLLNAVFDSSPIGIAVCDRDLQLVFVNCGWAAISGFAPEEHTGKTVCEILKVDACPVEAAMKKVLTTGDPVWGMEIIAKVPVRPEAGRWVINLFPLKDETGKTTHIGSITIETTPRKGFSSFLVAHGIEIDRSAELGSENHHPVCIPLSPREVEVTRLLVMAKSNKEIATTLGISVKTVETHRRRVMQNLQIHSMVELALYAVRAGIVKLQ